MKDELRNLPNGRHLLGPFHYKNRNWCSKWLALRWEPDIIDGTLYASVTVMGNTLAYSSHWYPWPQQKRQLRRWWCGVLSRGKHHEDFDFYRGRECAKCGKNLEASPPRASGRDQ